MTALEIILIAITTPMLTDAFDDFTKEGFIFEKYGNWLRSNETFWKKPIGGCLVCTNVWVYFLTLSLLYFFGIEVALSLIGIGIGNFMMKLMYKHG